MDHGTRKHALLSASGSSRWLACPPSARLEEPFENTSSDYAKEGTLAHEIADAELRVLSGEYSKHKRTYAIKKLEKSEFYSKEMPNQVGKYVDFVHEQFSEMAFLSKMNPAIFVEARVDFSDIVPEGFGTGDCVIATEGILRVIDLKYGKGIKVDAPNNSQLMLYAYGALKLVEFMYEIDEVEMIIVQPRLNHISTWKISIDDLLHWAYGEAKEKAKLAWEGKGEKKAGDHCKWCKAKPICPAIQDYVNEIAKHDFSEPELLGIEDVIEMYERIPILQDYAKSISDYLNSKALKGEEVPGYKLVEGRSNRRWVDEDAAIQFLKDEFGFNHNEIVNTKLKGIGDISNLMSLDDFENKMKTFIHKPEGKPTLVPESDKRQEYGISSAQKDFNYETN